MSGRIKLKDYKIQKAFLQINKFKLIVGKINSKLTIIQNLTISTILIQKSRSLFRKAAFDAHLRQSARLAGIDLNNARAISPRMINEAVEHAARHLCEDLNGMAPVTLDKFGFQLRYEGETHKRSI